MLQEQVVILKRVQFRFRWSPTINSVTILMAYYMATILLRSKTVFTVNSFNDMIDTKNTLGQHNKSCTTFNPVLVWNMAALAWSFWHIL